MAIFRKCEQKFECQCCSRRRRMSQAAAERHYAARLRYHSAVNEWRTRQGKDPLPELPRPVPVENSYLGRINPPRNTQSGGMRPRPV